MSYDGVVNELKTRLSRANSFKEQVLPSTIKGPNMATPRRPQGPAPKKQLVLGSGDTEIFLDLDTLTKTIKDIVLEETVKLQKPQQPGGAQVPQAPPLPIPPKVILQEPQGRRPAESTNPFINCDNTPNGPQQLAHVPMPQAFSTPVAPIPHMPQFFQPHRASPGKMAPYKGEANEILWHDWRENFERYARACGVLLQGQMAAERLALCLEGEALQYFNMLSSSVKEDYQAAVKEMSNRFGCPGTLDLNKLKQRPGESANAFTTRFMAALRSAYGEEIIKNPISFSWIFDSYCSLIEDQNAVLHISMARPKSLPEACEALTQYLRYRGRQPALAARLDHQSDLVEPASGSLAGEEALFSQPMRGNRRQRPRPRNFEGENLKFKGQRLPYMGQSGVCWLCGSDDGHSFRDCELWREKYDHTPTPNKAGGQPKHTQQQGVQTSGQDFQ